MNTTDTSEHKIIITGIGGQGIVFLTRLISYTAVNLGRSVVVSETHGMSQRGGLVISHLKINGSDAPLIQRGSAELMIAMDPTEAMQNMDFVRRGGTVFVNGTERLHPALTPHLERLNIRVVSIRATEIAVELGAPAAANIVMAGFVTTCSALNLPVENMVETLQQISNKGFEKNLLAFDAGCQMGRKKMDEIQTILENAQ